MIYPLILGAFWHNIYPCDILSALKVFEVSERKEILIVNQCCHTAMNQSLLRVFDKSWNQKLLSLEGEPLKKKRIS